MIIQLPFVTAYPDQGRAVVDILKNELPSYIQPGVQAYRGPVDMHRQVTGAELVAYVKRTIPKDFFITLHAQISDNVIDKRYRLDCDESMDYLQENIRIAQEIGAQSVIIHPNTVFQQSGESEFLWTDELDDYMTMQKRIREPMFILLNRLANCEIIISVENMPVPVRGDKKLDPGEILYEPNMNSYEDLAEYCARTPDNAGITFDTAHYETTRRVLNRLLEGVATTDDLRQTPYRGVYPGHFSVQPAVLRTALKLLEQGKISDVQMNDTDADWVPHSRMATTGVQPGKGFIGDDLFKLGRAIDRNYPEVPVSFDIEEQDYLGRPNQRAAIKRFLEKL